MASDPIPFRRPDPEVQALKADLIGYQAKFERLELRMDIAELRATSTQQFTSAFAWMILALLLAVGIGAWAFIVLAIAVYCAVLSLAAQKRANDLTKKLSKHS